MKRIFLLFAVVATIALLGFACGDDDDDDTSGDDGGEATSAAPADTGEGDDGGATSFDIEATDFAFEPNQFTVPVGEAVTFNYTNDSGTPHTFTVYTDEEYTDELGGTEDQDATTEMVELTFDAAQDYYFRCELHPQQMQGEIVAE